MPKAPDALDAAINSYRYAVQAVERNWTWEHGWGYTDAKTKELEARVEEAHMRIREAARQ